MIHITITTQHRPEARIYQCFDDMAQAHRVIAGMNKANEACYQNYLQEHPDKAAQFPETARQILHPVYVIKEDTTEPTDDI